MRLVTCPHKLCQSIAFVYQLLVFIVLITYLHMPIICDIEIGLARLHN